MPDAAYLEENPKYIEHLEKIVEHEEDVAPMDDSILEGKPFDARWSSKDVKIHSSTLYQLEINGFLERVYDSNKYTDYALVDRDKTKEILDNITIDETTGTMEVIHDFPEWEQLPADLFDDVVGYDKVKWLLKRGITTDKITNFLLIGPPGSAKTVFLLCLEELEGTEFIPAMDASAPGFLEVMFEKQPRVMMFDELDDMPKSEQKSLSSYTETGIVKETKHDKTREMKTNAKTFASANSTSSILNHIEDRFTVLEFEKYTKEEYIEVCENILPDKENSTPKEARTIAELLFEKHGEGDVRKAISVARLSRGDPERVISVLDEFSADKAEKVLG
jgi:Holliday junction DNA helicase RuvB